MKEPSLVVTICNKIIVSSIYILAALIPVFFLPWTADALDFNKQALLVVLVLTGIFAWMLKTVVSGSATFNTNKTNWAILALLVAYGLSTIFSVAKYGSFWGWPLVTSESLLSLICLVAVYFLTVNTFSEKEIFTSFSIFSISALVALLYGVLSMLGLHVLPWSFAENNSFNTVGSVGSLGFFAAALLPLFIIFAIIILPSEAKRWWKILFVANIILTLAVLLLVNYRFVWLACLLAAALLVVLGMVRRDILDGRWMFLPIFFLVVALFFAMFQPPLAWVPQKALEVSLSQKANLAIDAQALKSSPLFGSGPGTFVYDYGKYRNLDLNSNPLWNITFNSGSSKMLTVLATTGVLGTITWLATLGMVIFYGLKFLIFSRSKGVAGKTLLLMLALLITICTLTFGYFFYNSNITIEFAYFLAAASLLALIAKNPSNLQLKTFALKSSPASVLIFNLVFTAILIFGLGFLMFEGQRYIAEVSYYQGVGEFREGRKDAAIALIKKAASNNSSMDIYFNQLSLFSLSKLQDIAASLQGATSADEATKAQAAGLINDAIAATNIATGANPNNVDNWSNRGYVCQNLIGLSVDGLDCSIHSYDRAITLNPTNPYLPLQQGNSYLIQSTATTLPADQTKDNLLLQAKQRYDESLRLKPDYATAFFQLALVAQAQRDSAAQSSALASAAMYGANDANLILQIGLLYYQEKNWDKAQEFFQKLLVANPNNSNIIYYSGLAYYNAGKKDQALVAFTKLQELNPDNEAVRKIIANMEAGRPALDSGSEQPPVPQPSTENPAQPAQ